MLKFSKQERDVIQRVHLLMGVPIDEVQKVFEGILYSMLISYTEKEPFYIPLLGELMLRYRGDTHTKQGLVAEVSAEFSPAEFMVHTIGQIEDGTISDLEVALKQSIAEMFSESIETIEES